MWWTLRRLALALNFSRVFRRCNPVVSYDRLDRRRPVGGGGGGGGRKAHQTPVDLSPFELVRKGLAESNTVGWSLAPQSIELATRVYPHPDAVRFLEDFLHQVTGIMLDQVCLLCSCVRSNVSYS